MPKTDKENDNWREADRYLDRILKWPEQGGFQPGELAKVLAELDARLERLERAHPELFTEEEREGW